MALPRTTTPPEVEEALASAQLARWVSSSWNPAMFHAPPAQVYGPCRGDGEHPWMVVGEHLTCAACGWVACCGVSLHVFAPRGYRSPCHDGGLHTWQPFGVHWHCSACSVVPCCSKAKRRRRGGAAGRQRLASTDTGRCYWCGVRFGDQRVLNTRATRDHLVGKVHGGGNQRANFVWACAWCNMKRGFADNPATPVTDWEGMLHRRRVLVLRREMADLGLLHRHPHHFTRLGAGQVRCPGCNSEGTLAGLSLVPCQPAPTDTRRPDGTAPH